MLIHHVQMIKLNAIEQKFDLHPFCKYLFQITPKVKGYLQILHLLVKYLPEQVALVKVVLSFKAKNMYTFLDLRDKYQLDIVIKNKKELVIPCILSLLIKDASLVFDIGANCGWYSRVLAGICPGLATIVAFEPSHKAFHYLAKNAIPGFFPLPFAVTNHSSKVMVGELGFLRLSSGTEFREKMGESTYAFHDAESCSTTVDAVAHALRLQPTILKIDVEGHELEVLQGAVATLPSVEAVVVEINESQNHEGLIRRQEIFQLLGSHQFRFIYLISVKDMTIESIKDESQPAGDILFSKKPLSFI